jgi:Tol biopolymer transport system component
MIRSLTLTVRWRLLSVVLGALVFHFQTPFSIAQQTKQSIMTMDADGANARSLAHIEGYTRHSVPRWSPNGREIAFEVSWKESGEYDPRVFKVSAEGGPPVNLGVGKMPCWSVDGKQIVFRIPPDVGESRNGIWIMNSDGAGREFLFTGHQPLYSPDGTRIAYTSEDQSNVFVYDVLEGSHRKLPQPYSRITGYAAWSPDGKDLCFIGRKGSENLELVVTAADGTQSQPKIRWSNSALARYPFWGPGKKILLTMRTSGNNDQIYTIDSQGDSEPQRFDPQPAGRNFDPCWSPDLKRIAFVSDVAP